MEGKPRGVDCYLRHMKELMGYAHQRGIEWLTVEPMSCLAEPPTLPEEIRRMADELAEHHRRNPDTTARAGYCGDISHGYADGESNIRHDHLELLEAALPHLVEIHLKNTDSRYSSTFGFGPSEREAGIVDVEAVRRLLQSRADVIPVDPLIGYLEIGGPKLGRDYSDRELGQQLRESLAYLKEVWKTDGAEATDGGQAGPTRVESVAARSATPACEPAVRVSPSVMCADLCRLEEGIRQLESAGADMLHVDMADGHFVPNLLLGMDVVRAMRVKTPLPVDVHLMVEHPDDYLDALGEIGIQMVAVHAEACRHLDRTLTEIRRRGMQAGVAVNPATPLAAIEYVRERLDYVLLMTVNPGFAGQKLVASGIRKIADCRRWLSGHDGHVKIMVDGNVSFENIPPMVAAGADILVAGTSSWYNRARPLSENVEKTARAIAAGLAMRASP
jgi:ribulose-phosphate 3-epimerase